MSTVIYVRISRDRAGTELGVARQERECRGLCAARGLDVADVLVDNDLSAYSGRKPRPGYSELMEGVKEGRWSTIVAWAPDRLHRSPTELEAFIAAIEAADVDVLTVQAGLIDLTTPAGRLVARQVGAVARYESEHKSARLKSKHEELAMAGAVKGGGRAFGFEPDMVTIRAEEADVIRWAADRILDGWSLRRVVAAIPLPTVNGGTWAPTTIRGILISPRTAGLRSHRGEVVAVATWPEILDRKTWERVRAVLTDPARQTKHTARRYLLTGLIRTTEGEAMIARPTALHVRKYCTPSGRRVIKADEVEADVIKRFLGHLDGLVLPELAPEPTSDTGVAAIEAEVAQLAALRGAGAISLDEWLAARAPMVERLEAARQSAAVVERARPRAKRSPEDIRARWDRSDFDDRREALQEFIEAIEVGPGRQGLKRYDGARVEVLWRD